MTHDSTINRLRDKLDMLSRFDRERSLFGAREPFGHGYRVSPVTEAEIISKEAEFGISFPEEYRVWLLRVGSGAGPDYGLFPLARITAKLLEDERGFGGEIESPTAVSRDHIAAIQAKWDTDPRNHFLSISSDSADGLLIISVGGCETYTGILTDGALTGGIFGFSAEVFVPNTAGCGLFPEGVYIWSSAQSAERRLTVDPERQFGFFAWYEDWLDKGLAQMCRSSAP